MADRRVEGREGIVRAHMAAPAQPSLPEVGGRLSIESAVEPGRCWTRLVGFRKDAYVLVETPTAAVMPGPLGAFSKGDFLTVRYLRDGMVVGFRTAVLGRIRTPMPLIVLAYPHNAQTHSLREHPRFECSLPCMLWFGGAEMRRGTLLDVSQSGFRVRVALMNMGETDAAKMQTLLQMEIEMADPAGRGRRAQRFTGSVVGVEVAGEFAMLRVLSSDSLLPLVEFLARR